MYLFKGPGHAPARCKPADCVQLTWGRAACFSRRPCLGLQAATRRGAARGSSTSTIEYVTTADAAAAEQNHNHEGDEDGADDDDRRVATASVNFRVPSAIKYVLQTLFQNAGSTESSVLDMLDVALRLLSTPAAPSVPWLCLPSA